MARFLAFPASSVNDVLFSGSIQVTVARARVVSKKKKKVVIIETAVSI